MKKLLSLLLAVSLCTGLAAPASAYGDVTDATLAEAVAVLSGLGIVSGYADGAYRPGEALTRAQFCKLAVLAEGHGDQAGAGAYRTLFSDVPGSGWAAPYVNLAYEEKLVSGYGNGKFGPDDAVTTAQAVTVALKLLGYTTADVGPFWPEDYMSKAQAIGLLDGLDKTAGQALTRGDAALLLYHLLTTDTTQGRAFYLNLCASAQASVLLLSVDAQADDGSLHAAEVYADGAVRYFAQSAELPASLEGSRGALLQDKSGRVCGFLPEGGVTKELTLTAATAAALTGDAGTLAVSATVPVLLDGERQAFQDCWYDLLKGDRVTAFYAPSGAIDLLWVRGGAGAETVLTGYYEDATPNTDAPGTVTVLGAALPVTEEGRAALAAFSIGDKISVALDRQGAVRSAWAASGASHQYGILKSADGGRAEVVLTSGVTAAGALSAAVSSDLAGGLVQVTATAPGKLSVSALGETGSAAALDVAAGTLGGKTLSDRVKLYDRVGAGPVREIGLDDILLPTVPASSISYVGTGADGKVEFLVLRDVTGDCWSYGVLTVEVKTTGSGNQTVTNNTVAVENSGGTGAAYVTGAAVEDGAVGGVAAGTWGRALDVVELTEIAGVTRADFCGAESVKGIPIGPDVQVYNVTTGRWTTLSAAKAFTDSFTVYYDRTPATGAQVRVIFAR